MKTANILNASGVGMEHKMTSKDDCPFNIKVIDTESLKDITDDVSNFEFQEGMFGFKYSLVVNGKKIPLREKIELSTNKTYSVKMTDTQGNEIHRILQEKEN